MWVGERRGCRVTCRSQSCGDITAGLDDSKSKWLSNETGATHLLIPLILFSILCSEKDSPFCFFRVEMELTGMEDKKSENSVRSGGGEETARKLWGRNRLSTRERMLCICYGFLIFWSCQLVWYLPKKAVAQGRSELRWECKSIAGALNEQLIR